MATVKIEGKTGFLKEHFVDHPHAEKAEIDEAWQADGNEGTISVSLIQKVRSDLGLTGRGRGKAKAKKSAGTSKGSSVVTKSEARRTGPKAGGRTATNGRTATTSVETPAKSLALGDDRTRILIELEGELDQMIHEIKVAGGLPEFEETLRRARRILARSHEE